MYTPTKLASRQFVLSAQTLASLSRAETALARLEERAERCAVQAALHRALVRLEAVSSIRIEGRTPLLKTILRVESLLAFDGTDTAHRLDSLGALDFADAGEWHTTLEVVYFQMALCRVYRLFGPQAPVDATMLLDIHALSRFGTLSSEAKTSWRHAPYRPRTVTQGRSVLIPPPAEELPAYIDDLCAFINQELYTPIAQAAIAHFQFECLKPFKTGLDKTGRLMSHAIIHRRGLANRLIAPIGLQPAIDTRRHAESLLPYRFGDMSEGSIESAIDQWAGFCAYSAEVSCQASQECLDTIMAVRNEWFERFGHPNRGSALEGLLDLMPGHPMLTVRQASALLGKSISSVNDALLKLESAGIVFSGDGLGRDRIYTAPAALGALEALERRMIPNRPLARDGLGA